MAAGIVVAAIIVISVIQGFKNGGLRSLWSIGCVVAAIVLSTMLNPMISDFLSEQVHLNKYIEDDIMEYLESQAQEELNNAGVDIQTAFIDGLDIPAFWKTAINNNNTEEGYSRFSVQGFMEYVSSSIAAISVSTLAFILTFILVVVILKILSVTFGIIDKIPLLSQVNKLVGIGVGLVKGLLVVWLIMIVIAFARNYSWGAMLLEQVLANPISAFFYRYNLLAAIFIS